MPLQENKLQIHSHFVKQVLSPFSVIVLFVVLMIVGGLILSKLSVRLQPSTSATNVLIVHFYWPKASAERLEEEATAKLEGILSTIKGIKKINSVSNYGEGYIRVELDEQLDIQQARFEAASLIRQTYSRLPVGVSFPVVSTNFRQSESSEALLSYTISGPKSAAQIQQYVTDKIIPDLSTLEGLADVQVFGGSPSSWQLKYSIQNLKRSGLTPNEIGSAVASYFSEYEPWSTSIADRGLKTISKKYVKLTTDKIKSPDWAKIPIKKVGGHTIFLTEVVNPVLTEQTPSMYYRVNGRSTVYLILSAAKNCNTILVSAKVRKELERIKKQLPEGYNIRINYDASEYLKGELFKIANKTILAIILLFLFILFLSRQLRYLLIIFIGLVCNLLLSAILYFVFRLELNLISISGITISIGMVIDNSIVVVNHIRDKKDSSVFIAVVGSTLTTIGAVCIIFFLDSERQASLLDFAWVLIINLVISIFISLFFIPALMQKLPLKKKSGDETIRRKRRVARWNSLYLKLLELNLRFRKSLLVLILLLFGIPVFLTPRHIEKESSWAKVYNLTFGGELYNQHLRGIVDRLFGGGLRLFLNDLDHFQYSREMKDRTQLTVIIALPKGATVVQMNKLVLHFEEYLKQFKQIELFECRVFKGEMARIDIVFKTKFEQSSFPSFLKTELETKAVEAGLADFSISGVGQGFSNEINTETMNAGIALRGFNYDELRHLADNVKALLLQNPRVEKAVINSTRDWSGRKSTYEYILRIPDREMLVARQVSLNKMQNELAIISGQRSQVSSIHDNGYYVPVFLTPIEPIVSEWQVLNEPLRTDSVGYIRLNNFAVIKKEKTGDQILREDQEYRLVVNYKVIGDAFIERITSEDIISQVKRELPVGYSIKEERNNFWTGSEKSLLFAIVFTIGVVFLICAILLNSILQALAIVTIIPISFIGVFFTSWFFAYQFDEGGYTSFIILAGVVVNAALYFLNDYNNLLKEKKKLPLLNLYVKSYNSKIMPVLLSSVSMILGLLPVIIYSKNDPFWYALSISTIGGLIFSLIAVLLFLPLFIKGKSQV